MPEKSFKANIYDVGFRNPDIPGQTPFETAIQEARGRPLGERYMPLLPKGRRLEHDDKRDGCYLLNFVTFEFAGPGRSTPETHAVPIDLDPRESFAHETAMLYDPETALAFLESTSVGMREGAIANYFGEFANSDTDYLLTPLLEDDAAVRARGFQTIRSIIMRVAMGPVTEADHEAGIGVIKSFGVGYDARHIDIEIKSQGEKGRTLSLNNLWRMVDYIMGSETRSTVTQLKVEGRAHDDDPLELIDLIQHREKRERILPVDEESRKVLHEDRWKALLEIRQEFLA